MAVTRELDHAATHVDAYTFRRRQLGKKVARPRADLEHPMSGRDKRLTDPCYQSVIGRVAAPPAPLKSDEAIEVGRYTRVIVCRGAVVGMCFAASKVQFSSKVRHR